MTPTNDLKFKSILQLSADVPWELRAVDLDRVLDAADDMGVKDEFTDWLISQPLPARTSDVLAKRYPEKFNH